jgi:hypothetical protein
MNTETAAPQVTDRPNITVQKAIAVNDFAYAVNQFLIIERDADTVNFARRIKSLKMSVEPEECGTILRVVTAYSFEYTAPIMQSVRGNMHSGRRPGDDLTIHPYPFCLIKSHRYPPPQAFK